MLRKSLVLSLLLSCSGFVLGKDVSPVPPVNIHHDKNLQSAVIFSKKSKKFTLQKAYNLQKAFVKNSVAKGVAITGFKAGLTAQGAAQAYGLDEPISGVLLLAPLRGVGTQLNLAETVNPKLELEFAYQISQVITHKITIDDLPAYVSHIAPAIEIPQINFPSNDYNGLDIIANNALGYKLVLGDWLPLYPFNQLDNQLVSLSCNGKVVARGKGSNAFSGQAKALVWLINNIVDRGYKVQKNQILITGNIVKITDAKTCLYMADFGRFGKLDLRVSL